jgi:hypothetical protein
VLERRRGRTFESSTVRRESTRTCSRLIRPTAKGTARKAVTVGPAPATSPADQKMHLTGAEQNRMSVSYSISTLLTRDLHDVFGENDSARRRAAIDEIFTEDSAFYDPQKRRPSWTRRDRSRRGRDQGYSPDSRYHPIAEPEELGNAGRVRWVSGRRSVRLRLTPRRTSSLFVTGGLRLSISFSTSYPDLRGRIPIRRTRQLGRGRKEVQ